MEMEGRLLRATQQNKGRSRTQRPVSGLWSSLFPLGNTSPSSAVFSQELFSDSGEVKVLGGLYGLGEKGCLYL